ncbi:oligosaccharide flippase family protein [Deinococcus wulumuqiensis]
MLFKFFSLSFVQILGFLIPVIVLPYLVRTLQPDAFGVYSVVQNTILFLAVIIDFGYTISGIKFTSNNIENENVLEVYLVNSILLRLLISVLGILISVYILWLLIPHSLMLVSCLAITLVAVSNSFSFVWFFQGVGRAFEIALVGFVAKTIFMILNFIFIRSALSIEMAIILLILPYIVIAIYCIAKINLIKFSSFKNIKLSKILDEFKEGWVFFTPSLFSIIFTTSGVFLLSYFKGNAIAGGYSAIEKLAKAVASINASFYQISFPNISRAFSESYTLGLNIFKRHLLISSAIFFVIAASFSLFGGAISKFMFGDSYISYLSSVTPLSIYIFFAGLNTYLGIIYLSSTNRQGEYAIYFSLCCIIAFLLFLFLTPTLSFKATYLGLVAGELILFALTVRKFLKENRV